MNTDKIKTIGRYAIPAIAGLLLGWIIFGTSKDDQSAHEHEAVTVESSVEYTCSMHPQVRQDEPGDCPICGMDLIPASDDDDHQDDDPFLFTLQERHSNWANVKTQRVQSVSSGASVRLTGKVTANEREQRQVTAHFPGRIETLFADYTGLLINRGQRLATIYSPELMQAQQELIQAAANKAEQPRLYESARKRLILFNLTQSQIEEIEKRGDASATMDVYASKTGILTNRAVSEGDYVSTGQNLFAIADLSTVWIELDAYETQLTNIKQGQRVDVNIPSQQGVVFSGKVEFVDPFLNPHTRSASVRITVNNKKNQLKPEMLVTAIVHGTAPKEKLIVVPSTSILWSGSRSIVYVKKSHDNGFSFEFREVETGPRTEKGYQVLTGLSEGEEIAVNGVFAIDAAAQLRGKHSMMAPPERISLPEPFRSNLSNLFDVYFDLKNALADDEPQTAITHSKRLQKQLERTGQHSLDGEHHMLWMETFEAINESSKELSESEAIEQQRVHFEPLSEAMIHTARSLGAIEQTWYVAFCPMVDGDRGAYWLSEFEQISNPYFGSMMLRCGEVRETLRSGVAPSEKTEPNQHAGHAH